MVMSGAPGLSAVAATMASGSLSWCCRRTRMARGTSAHAQTFQGSLTGTVTDPTGAVIPGVTVTAVEQDRGFRRRSVTLDDGTYKIALLPPGRYALTAEKEGFEKTSQGPIKLTVNQHQLVDFQLKVGSQATVVTVEAPPVVVDTQTSSVGTTINQTQVSEVPLNGRQFLELMMFTPGVVPGTPGSRVNDRGGSINVNGMQDSMNSY